MRILTLILIGSWVFLLLSVAILFIAPKPTLAVLGPQYFHLFPFFLLLTTAGYLAVRLYRWGMKRWRP
jgi:hypothetical protein